MKMTTKQVKMITNLYHDYTSIDCNDDLRKRNLSLSDYSCISVIATEIQNNGKSRTFISNIADYFKKFGFQVIPDMHNVNFIISF